MSKKQLDKEAYIKFFSDVNRAMTEKTREKMTLAMALERNNVELDLPKDIIKKIQPALEMDLNAPMEVRAKACAACSVCSVCVVCGEENALSGLGSLVGVAGVAE